MCYHAPVGGRDSPCHEWKTQVFSGDSDHLASEAHRPAVEGTFVRTDRHERDRRAKFGKQDDTSTQEQPKAKAGRKKAKR